tara:strand:- start:838 stop:1245 length:408 start_codon:yes stop_codon:yes gene_type:complete
MNLKKIIYVILGFIFFSIGILGYYMPVLPGTIFLIISAYFFMHSSDKLYNRIINNPIYGNPIKQYIENHIIPFRTKIVILLSMWIATIITIYITPVLLLPIKLETFNIDSSINIKILGIVLAAIGTIVVLRAKNK